MLHRLRNIARGFRFGSAWAKANAAIEQERWAEAAERLQEAHSTGLASDMSRYLLGAVYGKLARCEESLLELEHVTGTLANP